MLSKLVHITITAKEKAVVGFIAAAIGTYLAQNNLTLAQIHSWSAFKALIVGVVTHQFVYWTQNHSS